ncbi:tRNA (N(6)-L-threonylcarbamoyladenosine(37)-C(2))-methylthiotransferase MtaB [Pontibacter sp. G13]|uniref:tRNA (N(6)-L-threonylcarbamoyladenosine(37)-C(2))- methylthiotransferase MtaB n=1 Tax=Pontibacter sp. G13 TaxID=3074898 RepID=UPI00288B02DF|nr:tRNA (N(6)-L-threonylcarbamoyladenosine(37)-C(2))-methylthiotransferase MtaB [Pontibacter sp. G13]WNJ20940.1 tRNA (N(6)-L-threonylcarbamoyladenosine(37)-C(2))-methylthiotransferase MtaB [Pontibacter sp. G13]
MQKVAFYTLGCKLNFSETSTIARQFLEAGFTKTEFSDAADVYIINTCSVTDNADKKCRKIIKQALKQNADAYIAVVGCYAQLKPTEISQIPGVDIVLGAGDKFRILELVHDFTKTDNPCVYNGDIKDVDSFVDAFSAGDRTRSFLKVQDGCDYKCTFCTIPLARGKSRSDSLENILSNAQKLADQGVKEVVLTGVNIGDYGKGLEKPANFLEVIQGLDRVSQIPRFRISSIEPNLCTNEIIQFVSTSDRFMPHFHMPLQSGNNEILGKMRRRYRRELYADRVAKIKELMPHACIGVDVIVGFPGETDAHFEDTYQFLHGLDISYLHVFTYSERANTLAADMEGTVPVKERHHRSKRLRMLSEKKKRYFYQQFEGETRPILFEEKEEDGNMHGFTDNYVKVTLPFDADLVNRIAPFGLEQVDANGFMTITQPQIPV